MKSIIEYQMKIKVSIQSIFNCSLERAFKTPMLCDVSKIHTGFMVMPKVTHTSDDENWGTPGFSKKVFVAKSFTQKGGFASTDTVIERCENDYWKIEVGNFTAWMLSFTKFVGEWKTTELSENKIQIDYTYTMHYTNPFFTPLTYLFTKLFWKVYMKRVLENVRKLAYSNEPYLYE